MLDETLPVLAEKVVLRPPVFLLFGLLLAALLHFRVAKLLAFRTSFGKRCGVGVLLLGWGAFLVQTCVRQMAVARTAPSHEQQTTVLLRSGAYSFCRNPMYVGGAFMQFGIVLLSNSLWVLLNTLAMLTYLNMHVIPVEEAHLASIYTKEYTIYFSETPRWFSMDMGKMEL